jgi:alanine racemase
MAEKSIGEIGRIVQASVHLHDETFAINRLLLDSRQFSSADGVLFFALRGKNHDGHQYLGELYKKGVKNFVVNSMPKSPEMDANYLVVTHTLAALQKLARAIRNETNAKVVGITGSNGKTIVKEWLSQILQKQFLVCRSPKSYNSQIGVPLSVWELEPQHEVGIFEAGISKPGEMALLEEILRPQIGLFTNIGTAHDVNFNSHQQKITEKLKLFSNSHKLVYQKNGGLLDGEIEAFASSKHIELLSWSFVDRKADLFVTDTHVHQNETTFKAIYKEQFVEITIPFTDDASKENAMHCWRLALEFGLDAEKLKAAFMELQPVKMRLEMKSGSGGNIIINDSYNSDLESLRIALHYLENQGKNRNKVLILSDMFQSGLPLEQLNARVQEMINRFELHQVIGIGEGLMKSNLQLNAPLDLYPTTQQFLSKIFKYRFRDSAILLKGARSFRFEEISARFESKSHETVLSIHFDRMVRNLNYFRSLLQPQTRIMAMVKAYSYGSGSYEVANLLEFHKVDYLGVAYTDEGVELRKAGISLPILVLNAEVSSFQDLIDYRLEPEIFSIEQLRQLIDVLDGNSDVHTIPVHIKLETGMNRLGFTFEQLDDLLQVLVSHPQLKVQSAFSHLAASDAAEERDFTLRQVDRFATMTGILETGLGYTFIRHICNSSGISQYPEAHFDMVRLGVGLYGVASNAQDEKHLKVVSELSATVSQIKHLKPGDSVGYGRTFVAKQNTTIAVVSIGYADGYRRSLSNGIGQVAIAGSRYPVAGRVCMDMIMVDVTGSTVKVGDEVEVFGDTISIYELAQKMDTIPYEVLTGIGQRVKRVYFME